MYLAKLERQVVMERLEDIRIVIMAGGKGSRIACVDASVPKPMIRIAGKPVLEHQIICLRKQGFTRITISVGYLSDVIKTYFDDGLKFGVTIDYIEEDTPLGTAGALYFLKNKITEDFLLINGDIIFDIDIKRFYQYHKQRGAIATLFTHPNDHPYDSGIVVANENMRVVEWFHKEDEKGWIQNCVNAGLHFFSPLILNNITKIDKMDLDRDLLKPLINRGSLYAYKSPEYVKDIGTPERFAAVETDIVSGKVQERNLARKQKAVFFDRDGIINKYVGFLRKLESFELVDGIIDVIQFTNKSGYLAIVFTNQPVIARGEVSWDELKQIHNKMETLLGKGGAFVDDIYICPHHPDKGFEGEKTEYKIDCDCRKPSPGLLLTAAEKYNIDISQSFVVGDSTADIAAGHRAGCKTIGVKTGLALTDDKYEVEPDFICEDLLGVYAILENVFNSRRV